MSDWILQKDNDKIYEQCMKFYWYMCWYMAFLVYRRYTYVLNSTEQTVYN